MSGRRFILGFPPGCIAILPVIDQFLNDGFGLLMQLVQDGVALCANAARLVQGRLVHSSIVGRQYDPNRIRDMLPPIGRDQSDRRYEFILPLLANERGTLCRWSLAR